MSKFTAGQYLRCIDDGGVGASGLIVKGRVYCVERAATHEYEGCPTLYLRGCGPASGPHDWYERRFELAKDFRKGDRVRIKCPGHACDGGVYEVLDAPVGVWERIRLGTPVPDWSATYLEHVGHDTPLTPLNEKPLHSSPSKAADAPSSSSLEKYVPKVGDRVNVQQRTGRTPIPSGGPWGGEGVVTFVWRNGKGAEVRKTGGGCVGATGGFDNDELTLIERPEVKPLMLPAKDSPSCSSLALEALREELEACRKERDTARAELVAANKGNERLSRESQQASFNLMREHERRDAAEFTLAGVVKDRETAKGANVLLTAEVERLREAVEKYKKAQPKPSFAEKTWGFAADGVAVLCAAFVVGAYFAVYVPSSFVKEKVMGLWGLACSAGSWVKGKASAARGWVNSGRVEPFVLTLSLMACAVMAGELAFNRLEEDWLRHEWAAASVRVLLPVERDWADEYVRALNGKALKPVERCGHASTLSLGSVPLTIFYRCVCGYESADLSKHVCGEAPKTAKGRWF